MENIEIGRFYAVTFNAQVYKFLVYKDHISCTTLKIDNIKKVILQPRMELITEEETFSPAPFGTNSGLIRSFYIKDNLFSYLKQNDMIMYSTDMAYLYDFSDKRGYDYANNRGRNYKRASKKGPILVKQRKGQFN